MTSLRPIRLPEDEAAVRAVIRAGWIDSYVRAGIVTETEVSDLFEGRAAWSVSWSDRRSQHLGSVVATDGKDIIGVVSMGLLDGGSAGEVQSLYVHPDHQGQRTGLQLWSFALGVLARTGPRRGEVWALSGSPSCEFYSHRGARPVKDGQFWIGNRAIVATGFEFPLP